MYSLLHVFLQRPVLLRGEYLIAVDKPLMQILEFVVRLRDLFNNIVMRFHVFRKHVKPSVLAVMKILVVAMGNVSTYLQISLPFHLVCRNVCPFVLRRRQIYFHPYLDRPLSNDKSWALKHELNA